jgi:glycosyltransferase involved in cell wall biosynthesis
MCRLINKTNTAQYSLIRLRRNFGQISALLAGYRHAQGDCIISMAADLQDPPEIAPKLFDAWLNGAKLVIGARKSRDDGLITNTVSKFAWDLLRKYCAPGLPRGGFDYYLMDNQLRKDIISSQEKNIFLQGRLLFYGYETVVIYYDRKKRIKGVSQTSISKKIKYFLDAFISSTYLPLRIMSLIGLTIFLLSLIAIALITTSIFAYGTVVHGWASTIVAILFLSGIQMLSLGILGEYIWRGIEEVRNRPSYLIDELIETKDL